MRNRNIAAFILTSVLTITVIIWFPKPALVQPTASVPELFTPAAPPSVRGPIDNTKDPTVIRQRFVKANFGLLTRTRGQALRLNLFNDVAYNIVIESTETPGASTRGQSGLVQLGRVEGIPDSEVYLATKGNSLSGNIRLPDGKLYQIRSVSPGLQVVRQINQAAFPPDHAPGVFKAIQKQSATRGIRNRDPEASFVNNSVIKVMVLYTPDTLKAVGGTDDDISTSVALVQAQTNKGFVNSRIAGRVSIVALREVDYPESGDSQTDLERLVNPSDGFLDNIPPLRQKYKADAVSLWVNKLDACGLGILNTNSADFRSWAFTVVSLDCATGNFSFAHEIGHNLGATHDPNHSKPDDGIFPYAHGYQNPDGEFRTIMAYKEGCSGECPRLNAWSNPNRAINEKPLGISGQADNALTLNRTL